MKHAACMIFVAVAAILVLGCSNSSDSDIPTSVKQIIAFSFLNPEATGVITESTHTIAVTVPYGTDLTALVPAITHTGVSIDPKSGVAQDFTDPVVYTVTALDSSTQDYTVTVSLAAPSTSKAITSFSFVSLSAAGVINESAHTIAVTVPGTDISSLIPTITHTGASISPASGTARNFVDPVVYTVTAQDSSTQAYTVTVTVESWSACGDTLTYAGENYPTVLIGTQCWFAKNMNAGTMVPIADGQGTSCSSVEKYCYDDDQDNCAAYGGLYTWTQAMCSSTAEASQGICPSGWHVPTDPEYVALTNYLGSSSCGTYRTGNNNYCGAPAGDRMKAAGLCEGRTPCGDSGFNGLLGGNSYGTDFYNLGNEALFWTSSINSNNIEAWRSGLSLSLGGVDSTFYYSDFPRGRSIRCIKD